MVPSAANFGDEEGPTRFARVAGRESEQAPLFLPPQLLLSSFTQQRPPPLSPSLEIIQRL